MSRLEQTLNGDRFVVTSELTPPKGVDLSELFARADALGALVDAFNITESHGARMSMDPTAVGHLLIDRGIDPIVQMTSRDKNRIAIQAAMLGAAALGVTNIVCMGGDPPKVGDHPDAKAVFDLFASQILEAAHALNSGMDFNGNPLKGPPPRLCVGAVVNPGAVDRKLEIENLARKIDAGARFFQTQAVYDPGAFESFMSEIETQVDILAGIIPIKSTKMARYMNERVPGVAIPDSLLAEIGAAEADGGDVASVSMDIAARTIRDIKPMCRGVHIMAIGWEDKIPGILERAGISEGRS